MNTKDFLLELGTEELPPKLLQQLSNSLSENLAKQLNDTALSYSKIYPFATPRRLAVLVKDLQLKQEDQVTERKGPATNAPEQAINGFAKSCNLPKEKLECKKIDKSEYYFFTKKQKGLKTIDLLENIVNTAIKNIPITRAMRWGGFDFSFARPVHWLVMLLGSEIVTGKIMGLNSGKTTKGMRFTGEKEFDITSASDYQKIMLAKANIEVDFKKRKLIISQQVEKIANANNAKAIIDENLLNEVCALVEEPRSFLGKFDKKFLSVPQEALISAMKLHQKYFHMLSIDGKLLPSFIFVANINSKNETVIIDGNQRVIRPRLTDAEFFWNQDRKKSLETRLEKLKSVLFMQDLGSVFDKVKRIEHLAGYIAKNIKADVKNAKRAALLCKSDLVSDMVGEFADLQGIMGGYYALNDGENKDVANAISEHYKPKFAHDSLPSTKTSLAVAIADKLDTITGIYAIGHKPTGSKDPYALKRSALGLMRMIIEEKLEIDLLDLIFKSLKLHNLDNNAAVEIFEFMLERLKVYYQEKNVGTNVFQAVIKSKFNSIYDFHLRVKALNIFMQDENSKNLIKANKRIKNILKDAEIEKIDSIKFTTKFDKNLFDATKKAFAVLDKNKNNYEIIINEFLELKNVIDEFFDNVMINDENLEIRKQRLSLIDWVRTLFLSVADIAYLSK